ncbi:MAG: glutathione S-transferase [Gammaproteobacteria bacterium]|jgi:glutathione S-transferase
MIDIYHSPGTRGIRVIWACEELGVPYHVTPVDFSPQYRATAQWRELSPVGKVPVMRDGELLLFESGAMMQHVIECYGAGRLEPAPKTPAHAQYLQWCWFAESTFSRPLGEITNHRRMFPDPIEACMAEMRDRAKLCAQALNAHLVGKTYLLGDDFTGADIMMGYSLKSFERHVSDEPMPREVAAYYARLTARPAYQATLAAEQRA